MLEVLDAILGKKLCVMMRSEVSEGLPLRNHIDASWVAQLHVFLRREL